MELGRVFKMLWLTRLTWFNVNVIGEIGQNLDPIHTQYMAKVSFTIAATITNQENTTGLHPYELTHT